MVHWYSFWSNVKTTMTKVSLVKNSEEPNSKYIWSMSNSILWTNFELDSSLDMSICRLRLGLKFKKITFDWRFLSQIKAWKCMSYSKVSLS